MALSVTLYSNTGFNTINIPETKNLLVTNAQMSTHAIDCMQNRFLQSITVKTTWEQVKDVDYANVDDFYYFVTGISMVAYDSAVLFLSPDFITSAGGPGALVILDGITERHHIAKSADTFGKYDEPDPLLSPAQPLELVFGKNAFLDTETDYFTLAESSIDLVSLGRKNGTDKPYEAITFTDPNVSSGESSVSVPHTTPVYAHTTFNFGGDNTLNTFTNGTAMYDVSEKDVQAGMQVARDLGVENAIVAQYALPKSMFSIVKNTDEGGLVRTIFAKAQTFDTGLPFNYATVRNQRVLSGESNKYGILAASGNSYEANPEQINNKAASPSIVFRGDGRENGSPFFNFDTYLSASNSDVPNFFKNAVQGMTWRNVPLTYITASRSIQDSYNFDAQSYREMRNNDLAISQYSTNQANAGLGTASSAVGSIASGISSGLIAGPLGALIGGIGGAVQAGIGGAESYNTIDQNRINEETRRDLYALQRREELYNFGVSQNVIVPTIKFPFQTPSIRDYAGNGCFTYRYRYSATDVTRIDKILTAYGYHITEMLDSSMFSNRPQFNFVKASGVSVGGNLPTWWKNGIAQQFGAGVRIWHVKPTPAAYTNNQ